MELNDLNATMISHTSRSKHPHHRGRGQSLVGGFGGGGLLRGGFLFCFGGGGLWGGVWN